MQTHGKAQSLKIFLCEWKAGNRLATLVPYLVEFIKLTHEVHLGLLEDEIDLCAP